MFVILGMFCGEGVVQLFYFVYLDCGPVVFQLGGLEILEVRVWVMRHEYCNARGGTMLSSHCPFSIPGTIYRILYMLLEGILSDLYRIYWINFHQKCRRKS